MSRSLRLLRLNQGDRSEARIYYCAHFVAAALGLFNEEGLDIRFVQAREGGHTLRGGQIPALLSDDADIAIGGPMVTMKMLETREARLVSFCASVSANPWVLAGPADGTSFDKRRLKGCKILDVGNVGTATLCFRWLLGRWGFAPDDVALLPGSGDERADFARVATGEADFALHSLHALAPSLAAGHLVLVATLATEMGPVPWSAFIARPERIAADRAIFAAFRHAIAKALAWIAAATPAEIAARVAPYYPDYPLPALASALAVYRRDGVLAQRADIARADFDRFSTILLEAGWLTRPAPYETLVDDGFGLSYAAGKQGTST